MHTLEAIPLPCSIIATLSQLSPSPISDFPVFPPIIRNYEHSSATDDFEDQARSVASPPILQVSDNDKDEESRDIEECLCKIDSLFEDGIFAYQEDTVVEKETDVVEEEVVVEAVVVAEEEKVAKNEKEKAEEDFVEKVVTVPGSMGTNIDNVEQTGVRPVEVAESKYELMGRGCIVEPEKEMSPSSDSYHKGSDWL
ncbi:hypothetical protein PVK06_009505 [Gossypium arboreum]|uniref:Uncharacterized protein n=1 Tax=Gossypium arboreum TaxID=29729 RepID=A0ABR0QNW1_GOSAR|nr:hypothetical protein PVK06_009505 [Gossypium arboreum]